MRQVVGDGTSEGGQREDSGLRKPAVSLASLIPLEKIEKLGVHDTTSRTCTVIHSNHTEATNPVGGELGRQRGGEHGSGDGDAGTSTRDRPSRRWYGGMGAPQRRSAGCRRSEWTHEDVQHSPTRTLR